MNLNLPRSIPTLKTALAASVVATIAGLTANGAPLVSIGERGGIFFNGSVTLRADDNVFLSGIEEESDVIFIFSPGVEFTYGTDAIWNFSAYYREDIYRYTDNSELNTNNSNVFLNANYGDGRLEGSVDASYQRLVQNSFDLAGEGFLVERDVYRAGISGEYDLTEYIDLGSGISYQRTDFKRREFRDTEVISVPVDIYYNFTERLDLSLGYRFRDNNTRGTRLDSQDHFINVGVRGEVTPMIMGSFKIGYQERQFKESDAPSDDQTGLAFDGQATWNASDRINVSVLANRDLRYGARGDTIEQTGGGARITYLFTELLAGGGGLHFQESRYRGRDRKDEKWTADIGVTYSPNEYVDLSADYIYTNNQSNVAAADLDRNIFQLTAALRY